MARDKDDIIRDAKEVQKQLNELQKKSIALTEKEIEKQKELIDKQKELRSELKKTIQDRLDSFKKEESSISDIGDAYSSLKESQKQVLSIASSMNNLNQDQIEAITTIQEANRQISKLSIDEVQARTALTNEYNDAMDTLKESMHGNTKILQLLKAQNVEANAFANKTEEENEELEESNKLVDFLKDKFGAVFNLLETLSQGPTARLGIALIGIGKVINAVGENVRKFGGNMAGAVYSTTLLGTVFKDAEGSAKGLAQEFGGMEDVSFATQLNTNLMATNMGISGEEAAKNLSIFARLNGNSKETATNMAQSAAEMARASGLNTAQVMGDIAANSEKFAEYSSDGGKNLALAAVQAAKLGVNMGTLTNVTDSLLDFETSITKELELGAMLGRNINLNRARALAYEGKVGASVKETIKQLGGVEAFNRMDIFQKRETAKLLGISVEELSKMSANMDKLNDDGSFQKSTWSTIWESMKGIASGPLGSIVQGIGGAAIAMGQMGIDVKALATKLPIVGKLFQKLPMRGAGTGSSIVSSTPIPTTPPAASSGGGMGAGMKGIASGLAAFANPATLIGLAAVTAAIIGIGFALRVAAPGIQAFGEAVGSIVRAVGDAVKTVISGLGDFFMKVSSVATPELALSVLGLSYGFAALTASLAAFSIVGLAAIPAMMAISAFGTATSLLGVGGETGAVEGGSLSEYEETMLSKMDSLISAVSSNKDVYLDKDKVTSLVMAKSDRSIINKLNIFNA